MEPCCDVPAGRGLAGRAPFDILVILAPPRSFTTLVSAMLGQHPQLYGLPETHFFTCDTVDEWLTRYRGTDRADGALRAVSQVVFGLQSSATVGMARVWLQARSPVTTADVLRSLGRRVEPRVLVEKTPQAAQEPGAMRRMLREFPEARFLHLTRHFLAQARSRLERRIRACGLDGKDALATAARSLDGDPVQLWLVTHRAILRFLDNVPVQQQFRVRAEDLLGEPEQHVRRVAQWLRIRSDNVAIEEMMHPERSPFAAAGPPNAPAGGDEKFFSEPILRRRSSAVPPLDAGLPWNSDGAPFGPAVQQLATVLGYG
jgi:Sulfotransferase family